MFIRCPACHTLFRIQSQQLKAARGQVRCGSCQAVFDGLESLVNREELSREELAALAKTSEPASRQWQLPFDEPSPESPVTQTISEATPSLSEAVPPEAPEAPSADDIPETTESPAVEEEEQVTESPRAPESEAQSAPPAAHQPVQPIKWSPRYTLSGDEPVTSPRRSASRIGWGLGSLVMMALLAGQLAWHNRDSLALDPRWRPWLQSVCDVAGCGLPPLRDPHAIEMVDRNVQTHPHYKGALLITATLVNQAPFAQPYPEVELSMTDLDQKRVASRRFKPSEYLDNGHPQGLIPPGASVRLKLEISDPGQQAVGFEFEFY